jgi:hypothetical protein
MLAEFCSKMCEGDDKGEALCPKVNSPGVWGKQATSFMPGGAQL